MLHHACHVNADSFRPSDSQADLIPSFSSIFHYGPNQHRLSLPSTTGLVNASGAQHGICSATLLPTSGLETPSISIRKSPMPLSSTTGLRQTFKTSHGIYSGALPSIRGSNDHLSTIGSPHIFCVALNTSRETVGHCWYAQSRFTVNHQPDLEVQTRSFEASRTAQGENRTGRFSMLRSFAASRHPFISRSRLYQHSPRRRPSTSWR